MSTAGKGHPYWYEWTVGLRRVVEMLRPESGIASVSFQVAGVKGWDDVVVSYADGRNNYLQIKHSRVGKNITFGELVGTDDHGSSLLEDLFAAWNETKPKPPGAKYILFTNRAAGESAGRSAAGVYHPPLLQFIAWLNRELSRVKSVGRCRPPAEWVDAWNEWLSKLTPGSPAQRLSFLKSFEINTNQEDLTELETSLQRSLSETFQIPPARALPLFHALDSALRRWTTSHETVTAEDAFTAMALESETELEHRAPPPPTPFFPSRESTLDAIETALVAVTGTPVIFLCADPGAGKTSLVSQLVNRRVDHPLQGTIGLRYFAFRPITPDSPLIPPDADRFVRPDRLWFSLLSQLRRGLEGKLREYQVPLRNDLLEWNEARLHVLRLAERLGCEMKRPFVIVIDGIDHAARAMRYETAQAKEFFASLPGPDEIGDSPIRLMLAGQPSESYPEYPSWLRVPNPRVLQIGIGRLDSDDICVLLRNKNCPIPATQEDATVKVIEEVTHGNTLAVVFSVEEARSCRSVSELRDRLANRRLGDGLQQYYGSIWEHALTRAAIQPVGMDLALATALCLTPERLTGLLMASAFASLGLSKEQWHVLLAALGPLLVDDSDGFRVLHNDIRIFLHGLLGSKPMAARREGASLLADYYLQPTSNRWFAHKSLLRLLRDAGREIEWARIFTVDWVFEAAAWGIPYSDMSDDCVVALKQGVLLRNWDVMHELACATETLERWEEKCDLNRINKLRGASELSVTFLHTETFVRPLAMWQASDLHNLVHDAEVLVDSGEHARAHALLARWLSGLSIARLCRCIDGIIGQKSRLGTDETRLEMGEDQTFRSLGAVCRSACYDLPSGGIKKGPEQQAEFSFEDGWVRASCNLGPFESLGKCFFKRPIRFLNNFETALRDLATHDHWPLVRKLMGELQRSRDRLNHSFSAQCTWWALRSEAALDDPGWTALLSVSRFGFTVTRGENLHAALAICRALGWKNTFIDASVAAQQVFDALKVDTERVDAFNHYRLLLRAAAALGQISSVFHRRGGKAAGEILPANQMAALASALWDYRFDGINAHQDQGIAGTLAKDLVEIAFQIGEEHWRTLLDAAKPCVEKYPVDSRRGSLWALHLRAGEIHTLHTWLKRWLGDDGWLWANDSIDRENIAEDLLPLARGLGEHELADRAEDRLRWLQITYRGHKEYAFDVPIEWFDALTKLAPESWRDSGLLLWTLSEACAAMGGDNRCSWQLGESLGAAAWACGPADVWRLLTSEYADCGTEYWFHPTSNRLVGGLIEHLKRRPGFPLNDKLAGWCLAVGFSRWFNDADAKILKQLRDVIRNSADTDSEQRQILVSIQRLTPGEASRNPRPDSSDNGSTASEREIGNLQELLEQVDRGEEIDPYHAVLLLRNVLAEQPTQYDAVANKLLDAVGVGAPYSWSSWSSGGYNALREIAELVSDDHLWRLVGAAIKYAGAGTAWTQGVARNLQHVLLARATRNGAPELRSGLQRLLQMHEKWVRGGRCELDLPVITLGPPTPVATWTEFVARCLVFLLASRSAEVIDSVLIGIHALANHEPSVIRHLFAATDSDPWKQHWILNAAEVWASLFPAHLNECRSVIEPVMHSGPLHQRLQAWIVLHRLARALGRTVPQFPHPPSGGETELTLIPPPRQILATTPLQHGSFRFVDRFLSSESTLKRVEAVTGADLSEVRSEVAVKLRESSPEDFDKLPWPKRIRCSGDTRIVVFESEAILDEAFDRCLRRSPLPSALYNYFTQAYLSNEDPWILRFSPLPDDDLRAWPSDEMLREMSNRPPDVEMIKRTLYILATQHRVLPDELVLAARAQVFSWRNDYILDFWWEEGVEDNSTVSTHGCPTTLSGRTFALNIGDWWEPSIKRDSRPLVFAVGGQQRLTYSFPQFFPARIWLSEFGWSPSLTDPMVWVSDGIPVVYHERIHGMPRSTQSGHPRQPLLDRWIVKRSEWDRVAARCGPFKMRDDFRTYQSNIER